MIIEPSKKNLKRARNDKSRNLTNLIKVADSMLDVMTEEEFDSLGSSSQKIAYLYPLYSEATPQTHHAKRIKGDTSKTAAEKAKASMRGYKIIAHYVQNVSKHNITLKLGKVVGRDEDLYGHIKVLFGDDLTEYTLKPNEKIALTSTEMLVNFVVPEYGGVLEGGKFIANLRISRTGKTVVLQRLTFKKTGKQCNVTDVYMPFSHLVDDHEVLVEEEGYERLRPALMRHVKRRAKRTSISDKSAIATVALKKDIESILLGHK